MTDQSSTQSYTILVVDDTPDLRDLLAMRVERMGHKAIKAENGRRALEMLRAQPFDLMLLDIMMPEMNGYEVLETVKADPELRHIPVIVISALGELDSVVKCIQLGAEDYLPKPFNAVLLKARIGACLEKKRLRDMEQALLLAVQTEREKAERLLLNILPAPIAERLKSGEVLIADSFENVTVLFADIVDFTPMSARIPPRELVAFLNEIFSIFDHLVNEAGLEKVKTSGDAYMAVSGLLTPRADHAVAMANVALAMQREVNAFHPVAGSSIMVRVGMHSGPVMAGVIGTHKFIYDLWGDTVNVASRMESTGVPGAIQISAATYELLKEAYRFEARGAIPVKGKGDMQVYLLTCKA
jgi:class 3 adenylate cyclase